MSEYQYLCFVAVDRPLDDVHEAAVDVDRPGDRWRYSVDGGLADERNR